MELSLVMASLGDFLKELSDEFLELFTKDQLLQLASHYDITITSSEKHLKDIIKDIIRNVLIDNYILRIRPVSLQPMVAPCIYFWTVKQKHPPTAILTLGRARAFFLYNSYWISLKEESHVHLGCLEGE